MNFKERVLRNIVNIPGWTTKRKLIVFESDDWGSIRMSSKKNYNILTKKGFNFDQNIYNKYDALESNDDLINLFEVLSKFKDSLGRSPVFTSVSIVANPDFDKIRDNNFQEYYWEPFTETLRKYPNHDKVFDLYKVGINQRLWAPVFHGREHLNVQRWMRKLKEGNKSLMAAFDCNITGIDKGIDGEYLGDFQAAFDLDYSSDIDDKREIIKKGLTTFKNLWGYNAQYFVATNGPFNNSLETDLFDGGVRYVLGERFQKEPLGEGKYSTHLHFLGMKNKLGQTYLTRNAFFEPSSSNYSGSDAVDKCMKDIERAFRWDKPAVISSHRVNYIGFIDSQNRDRNLMHLSNLLNKIISRWPDVEFLSSVELGDLISKKHNV